MEELQAQVRRAKEEAERTSSLRLNEQERREIELNLKVGQLTDELQAARDQKAQLERLLGDRSEALRRLEEEIGFREEKVRRWEREVSRLEDRAVKETEKSMCVQSENDRLRTTKIDDAMVIERLRNSHRDIQEHVSEIVAVLAQWEAQEPLRGHIARIKPLSNESDILPTLRELRFVISSMITAATQALHQRDPSPPQRDASLHLDSISDESRLRLAPTAENLKLVVEQLH